MQPAHEGLWDSIAIKYITEQWYETKTTDMHNCNTESVSR